MTNIILCIIVGLLAIANLCLSVPTLSDATASKSNLYEEIQTSTPNSAINSISSEDYEYRSRYAAQMLSFMNHSEHPCNDFYEYSCGNFKNVIDERMGTTKRSNFFDITYKLIHIAGIILQRAHINDVAPQYAEEFELAKKIYNNCLSAELHPMRPSPEYLAVLKEIGGFPAVEANWSSNNFNWLNMSAHLSNYGVKSFITENIIYSYPFAPAYKVPDFGFDIELQNDTINNSSSNAYVKNQKRIRDILAMYGVKEDRISDIVTGIFDLIKEILIVVENFNGNSLECKLLQNEMEDSDVNAIKEKWSVYREIAWQGEIFADYLAELEICCGPCYYLYDEIDKIVERNNEAAANYLSLKFLFHMDAQLKDEKFQKDFCLLDVKTTMKYFFDHLYMKLYFSNEMLEEIGDIIIEIQKSVRYILQTANWLDESTREAALRKESSIKLQVGRYENETLSEILIGELKKLKFVDGSYAVNNLNKCKFNQHMKRFVGLNYKKLDKITKPLDVFIGMQANSFYYNNDNTIYVLAGILNEPVYNKMWPHSLKFGSLGYAVGHEFTHSFDTLGANYDETGQENYWWSAKSGKVFRQRSNCYVNHYERYLIPEINRNVNGDIIKDESIADSGGLHEALIAYRRYIKKLTKEMDSVSALYKEEQMPGIDLAPEQLFFLGFAQMWCASYKEAHYWEDYSSDHGINKYRVLGALSNNADFAKAYHCPVGSKMNPSPSKCEIW